MQESSHSLSAEEKKMINRVLDLQNITVAQVATLLVNTVTVTTDTPMDEVLKISREKNVTRLPVVQKSDTRERIIGVLSLKKLLYRADLDLAKKAGDYVTPAFYLPADLPLEEALRRMQRSRRRLAIVLGRDQKEIGVISLQDILRVIFGEVGL